MSETRSVTVRAAPVGVAAGGPRPGLALLVLATAQLMVGLDATIVNAALPHIQRALGFSGSGLEWVVNAYALTLGGLLLLGGRTGDLLGRRKMFIAGLLLFSAASLVGGFATSQAFLLRPRHPGRRRRAGRPGRAVADHHHLPRGPAAHPGVRRVRRDEHRRRRDRPDRRRPADHLRLVAVGAVRQPAHRRRGPAGRTAGAGRDPPPPPTVRPGRPDHRHPP